MSKYNIEMGDDLFNRVVSRCAKEGITPADIVDRLLREWVGTDDDAAPAPILGCDRPLYSFKEYVIYRRSTTIPIIAELVDFRAFTQGQGPKSMPEWFMAWRAFCVMLDARDERETQEDALV